MIAEKINKKKRKKWPFVLGIILIILVIGGLFFYFITAARSKPRAGTEIANPIKGLTAEQAVAQFDKSYIDYLVFVIGGWKLHNPPLSKETPKIKVIVDSDVFVSEIIDGEIRTEEKDTGEEDIIIRIIKEEIVNSILSLDMEAHIKESISNGKTTLELKASYTKLFSKGYLSIYKDITGKSFTGSVVEIFGQD